jgi:hypothetical protein
VDTYVYEITDRPGMRIAIGQQPGEKRPTLYLIQDLPPEDVLKTGHGVRRITLASFHGEKQAQAAANYFDTLIGMVQRVIDHLTKGDDPT